MKYRAVPGAAECESDPDLALLIGQRVAAVANAASSITDAGVYKHKHVVLVVGAPPGLIVKQAILHWRYGSIYYQSGCLPHTSSVLSILQFYQTNVVVFTIPSRQKGKPSFRYQGARHHSSNLCLCQHPRSVFIAFFQVISSMLV